MVRKEEPSLTCRLLQDTDSSHWKVRGCPTSRMFFSFSDSPAGSYIRNAIRERKDPSEMVHNIRGQTKSNKRSYPVCFLFLFFPYLVKEKHDALWFSPSGFRNLSPPTDVYSGFSQFPEL